MRWKLLTISFFVGLIFITCKKEPLTYKIEGVITDKISNKTVSNVLVKLYEKEVITGVVNDKYTFFGEMKTDSKGNFAFETPRKRIYDIKIDVEDEDYYLSSNIFESKLVNSEDVNFFEIDIESRAWVAIILNNPFVSQGEHFNLNKSKFKEGCDDCCENGTKAYIEVGDTTIVCAAVGGTEVILNYGVANSGVNFNATIECVPFDTVYHTVNY